MHTSHLPLLLAAIFYCNFSLVNADDVVDAASTYSLPSTASPYMSKTGMPEITGTFQLATSSFPIFSSATATTTSSSSTSQPPSLSNDSGVDNDAGASGSDDGGWQLSSAGIGAICGVIGLIAIFGSMDIATYLLDRIPTNSRSPK